MARRFPQECMRYFIGDVRDKERLEFAMHGIETVIHAAALKIVPTAEYNPTECIATNVKGAENVVTAAIRSGVKRVVALSTDKAVNPVNLYGASKLAAEKIFVAANNLSAGKTIFSIVRYGNVAGSRGSVIPYFLKMKKEGRALTITDPRMTRFWITLDQAVDLVYSAVKYSVGRDIMIPKIPSFRITDLADAINGKGCGHEVVGIRPGEKLHECLMTEDESVYSIDGKDQYIVMPPGGILSYNDKITPIRYTSDMNNLWLTTEQLKEYIDAQA